MALIVCPECGKQFSDKAKACPKCGCPKSVVDNQIKCVDCGKFYSLEQEICPFCGCPKDLSIDESNKVQAQPIIQSLEVPTNPIDSVEAPKVDVTVLPSLSASQDKVLTFDDKSDKSNVEKVNVGRIVAVFLGIVAFAVIVSICISRCNSDSDNYYSDNYYSDYSSVSYSSTISNPSFASEFSELIQCDSKFDGIVYNSISPSGYWDKYKGKRFSDGVVCLSNTLTCDGDRVIRAGYSFKNSGQKSCQNLALELAKKLSARIGVDYQYVSGEEGQGYVSFNSVGKISFCIRFDDYEVGDHPNLDVILSFDGKFFDEWTPDGDYDDEYDYEGDYDEYGTEYNYEDKYEYLWQIGSERSLTLSDISGLTKSERRILRNYFYAREGRKFKSADLSSFFDKYSWYRPIYDEVDNRLTNIQKSNVQFILNNEK